MMSDEESFSDFQGEKSRNFKNFDKKSKITYNFRK